MKKHILIVSQYFYPEQFRINDIAAEWVKRGHRVTVLTGIPNYPEGKFYPGYGWHKKRKETWNGVEIIRIPLLARGGNSIGLALNYASFVFSGCIWKCFARVKADIVFTFEVSPMTQALIGVWYSKKHKIPHYLYVQDLWPEAVETAAGIHNRCIIAPVTRMVEYIYKHCDKIFATSPSFVTEIQKRLSDGKDKVCFWPQYAEDLYSPTTVKSELIPQDGVLNITFTGNIGTSQGLEILPQAAALLKEKGIRVRFNVVGEGRGKKNLLQQIDLLGVGEFFNIVGRQPADEIPSILSASDAAFVSFSDDRLFSMTIPAKLQSYMACGCPIIASADGETKRVITESRCGIVANMGSAESLCDAVMTFLQLDRHSKKSMSDNAISYYKEHFDKQKLMRIMESEYLETKDK